MEPAGLRFLPTLAEAWRSWRRSWRSFAVIAVVLIPLLALAEVLSHELDVATNVGLALTYGLTSLVVAAVSEAFGAGLADHVIYQDRVGRRRLPWWHHARSLPLLTLVALAFLIGIVMAVGLVLLVLPGLAAYAWLAVAPPVASFERLGVWGSLRRSVALVRGRFWPVAALTVVPFAPVLLVDALGSLLRTWHAPFWLLIVAESAGEAVVIGFTAAVVVTVYHTLRTYPRTVTPERRRRPPRPAG